MLSVYRIFQLILGIIVSVTILYFLITYSSNYGETQKGLQKVQILKSFADEARSVYLTGISTNFTYFSRYDFSSCYVKAEGGNMPEIDCLSSNTPGVSVDTPVLFYPGQSVYVGRDTLDYGWWVFNVVEVMPSTVFVFNPVDNTDESWSLMESITEHLLDTSDDWSVVNVGFALCSGSEISYPCGGVCSKSEFLSTFNLEHSGLIFDTCTASLKKNMRLITISTSCNQYFAESGVCINPYAPHGVGSAFIHGSGKSYVWKDPLDLVALSMGGSEKDDFGKTMGEKIYEYKNSVLMERLSLAAEIMSKRYQLVTKNMPVPDETGCYDIYAQLFQTLDPAVSSAKDYTDVSQMESLNENLNKAKQLYQQLVEKGCERENYV